MAALLPSNGHAQATVYQDNASGNGFGTNGSFTWSTSSAVWITNSAGNGTRVSWSNTNSDNAVLGSGSGTSSYTATLGTAVTVGKITVVNGTWSVALGSNTLTFNSGSNWTFGDTGFGAISGAGNITKNGANTLTLSGTNSYTGVTTINAGTLSVTTLANGGSNSALGAANNNANRIIFNGGTLQYNSASNATTNRLFTVNSSGGTIDVSNSGSVNFSNTGTIAGGGTLTLTGSNTGANTIASKLSSTIGLTKTGSGSWALTNNTSNRSGVTTLSGGTLSVTSIANGGSNSALGAANNNANRLIFDGGTLQYTGSGNSTNRLFTLTNNGGTIDASGSGALNFTNNSSITTSGSGTRTLTLTGSGAGSLNAGIVDGTGGATSLVKSGNGTWTLGGSGTSTYTGTTQIQNGILNIQKASALGNASSGTTVSNGATLQLQGNISVGSEALTVSGAGYTGQNGALVNVSGTNTYGGLLTLGAATTISSDAGTLTLSNTGTITGSGFGLTLTGAGNGSLASIIGTGTGTLTKSGAGTWTLTGNNTYTGTTSISNGVLNIQHANALGNTSSGTTVSSGATLQLQGNISVGGEALTVSGTGYTGQNGALVNVSGTNTYGGLLTLGAATTVSSDAGTLTLSNAGTITGSGFGLTLTGAGNGSLASIIGTGTGTLTKSGTGTWTLTGDNTYTGTTSISNGVLNIQHANALGNTSSGTTVSSGATLQLQGNILVGSEALTVSGAGYTGQNGALVNVSGTNTYGGLLTLGAATTISSDAGSLTLSNAGTITGSTFGLTLTGAGDGSLASIIGTGTGTLTKSGAGTWTLTGNNTYTGTTSISNGVLNIQHANALGNTSSGTTVSSGATLQLQGNISVGSEALNVSGTGYTGQNGALVNVSGTNTYGGLLTLGAATTISSDAGSLTLSNAGTITGSTFGLTLTGAGNGTLASGIGTGTGGLTKSGAGTWSLTNNTSNYTGVTTISAGALSVTSIANGGSNSALGAANNNANRLVFDGGTLQYTGTGNSTNRLFTVTNNGGTIDASGSAALNFTNNSAMATSGTGTRTLTLTGTGAGSLNAGIVDGSGGATSLVKSGTGTWTLGGTSTSSYTGTTQITNGVLNIQNANALGNTSSGTTVSSGATLQLQGGITVGSEALNLSGAGYTGQNGALVNVSGTNTYGGLLTLGAAATISSDSGTLTLSNTGTISGSGNALTLTGSGNGSLAGIIGTNAGTLTKSGSGTWTLSGANTFTGSTSISGGTLTLANALALQNSTLNYNSLGGSLGFGALTSATLGGLSGGQNLALTNGSSAAVALTVGNNSGSTTYSGVLSGGGSLTKTGSGTLTLSGTNTYTGTTTVSAGTLQIGAGGTTGSIASTSVVDNAALSFNRSNSLSYSGVISGTGTLSQDGAGALTLSGANTFSGITTITGGTLTLANSLALQNSTLNYNSLGGSLSFGSLTSATLGGLSGAQNLTLQNGSSAAVALSVGNNNADTTYSGALSGSGSLTKVGTGTLTLSGTNTYSGATTIQRGTLQAGSANALAGRDIVVNAVGGGTATFAVGAGTSTTIGSLTFGGVGGAATSQNLVTLGNASSTLTLGGNVTYDATGNPLASTISTVSGTGTLDLGSSVRTFNIGDSSNTTNELTIASNLAGSGQSSGGLTKTGAGTLTLSGPSNTFNGLVTVNSGTLAANGTTDTGGFGELGNHNWVTGPAPTTVIAVNSGATLQVNSTFTDSIAGASSNTHQYETLSLNGTGTDGTGALKATGGINTWWGNVTLAGNTTITNTAASGDSNALYLGPLLFSSAPTDFKLNGHALTITGSGDTQISNMIGDSAGDSGSVTVNLSNANALVYFNGIQNYYTGATTVDQGTLFLLVDPGSHANAAILGDLAIGDGSGSADSAKVMTYYSDQIADSASVTIKSDGLLDLGTYGRDETIGALTLAGGHISTHGDNDGNLYLGANVHVTASSVIDGDATNGGINLNSSDSNLAPEVRTFDVDLGQTLTVNAVVHDRGSGFIKDGTGTMVLTRDNTFGYAGIAEVKNGILNIQDSGALGQNGGGLSSKGTVVDSGATLQLQKTGSNIAVGAETLNLSGTGYTSLGALENVSGANSWAGLVTLDANSTINTNAGSLNFTGQMTGSAGSGQTQTLTVTGAGDTTISSRIFDNRVNAGSDSHTGTLALTKNGSGTLTLSNSNSFTGDVRVNAGTLNVTANDGFGYAYHVTHLVSTSNVVYVESGATLGFTTVNTVNYISQLTNTNAATNAAGGVVSLAGNGTQTASSIATLVVNTASHDYFGGSLSGGGLLLKDGAGTLTFTSAANNSTFNFAGTVELAATGGTLEFKGGSGSGTTSTDALTIGTLKLDGGTLALTNAYINVGTLLITGDTVIDFGTGGASILNATNIYVAAGVTVTIRNWTSEYDFLFAKNTGYATSGGFRLTDANGTLATFNAIGSTPESQIWFEGDPQSPDGSHTTWINDQHNSWQDRYTDWEIRPIPEPSTYGALLLGAAGLLVFIRRRRNASAA